MTNAEEQYDQANDALLCAGRTDTPEAHESFVQLAQAHALASIAASLIEIKDELSTIAWMQRLMED